jgi:two-component system response regulator YesN
VINVFKVVIIDDEALVRVGLKSIINWDEQGCELVGEASNGQVGYDLIINTKPDIVITDIKMPVIDGLEMIKKLNDENIKPKFIILSSFNEFNLARQAMKYGVEEYLIKLELEPNDLISILNRIKEKIVIDYEKKSEAHKIEKHMRASKYAMREEIIKKIIRKAVVDEKEISEELEYLQIKLVEDNISCIAIQIKDAGKLENYDEADMNLLEFSILNILDEISNDFFTAYSFKLNIKEYAIVFSGNDNKQGIDMGRRVEDMAQRLITMLKQYFNIDVIIGVSDVNKGLRNIGSAYSQSKKALQQSFYNGDKKVIYFNGVSLDPNITINLNIHQLNDDLLKYIEIKDIEAIEIIFENVIALLTKEKVLKDAAYDICAKIAYLITAAVEEDENAIREVFGDSKSVFEKILKLGSIQDIISWLRRLEKSLCCFLLSKDNVYNNKVISRTKRYVIENLSKPISLHEAANKLNMSPGYLSTVFKQSTGVSFIDYVTEVRIEEAKRLLKENNHKIYEVAQLTGYENAYYFSKVFKKITGITPKEFVMKTN